MKSLIVLEHPEDLDYLRGRYNRDDVFIGFTPAASYELERNNIPHKVPGDYYEHNSFFSIYKDCTSNLVDIVVNLDRLIWGVDERFRKLNAQPFFMGVYQLKNVIDCIKIYIYLFSRMLEKERPEKVIAVSNADDAFAKHEDLLFAPEEPLCSAILSRMQKQFNLELEIIHREEIKDTRSKDFMRPLKRNVKKLSNMIKSAAMLFDSRDKTKTRVLCIDSRDLKSLKEEMVKLGYQIDFLYEEGFDFTDANISYKLQSKFLQALRSDGSIRALCTFESTDFYDLIEKKILQYTDNFDLFVKTYINVQKFLGKRIYDVVVLGVLSASFTNIALADICRKKQIPFVCWMHGGYGAYKTFEGYDMEDLLFGSYYFTYGEAINRAIDTFHPDETIGHESFQKICQHYPVTKARSITAGAPFMEGRYCDCARENRPRKVVAFIMGELWYHNQYYMGGNSPYTYFQKWNDVKKILNTLIEYQNTYSIIIKTYTGDDVGQEMLIKYLFDKSGTNIEVIRKEITFDKILRTSDLAIFTWVSTTFFQFAFSECDQFLFDNADLTEEARKILSESCFFFDKIDNFCNALRKYLNEGNFYQTNKNAFRKFFLDFDNARGRTEYIDNVIRSILRKEMVQ